MVQTPTYQSCKWPWTETCEIEQWQIFLPLSWLAKQQKMTHTDSTEMNPGKEGEIAKWPCYSFSLHVSQDSSWGSLLHYYVWGTRTGFCYLNASPIIQESVKDIKWCKWMFKRMILSGHGCQPSQYFELFALSRETRRWKSMGSQAVLYFTL